MGKILEMTAGKRTLAALAALAVLAGCGTDREANPALGALKTAATKVVTGRTGAAEPAPAVTRAQLAQFNTPMIMAEVPALGLTTFFVPYGENGGVETWSTVDDKTIALRQGIMVATRGFGPDIMQSEAPTAAQIASGAGTHKRVYYYLDGADQTQRIEYTCTLANLGAETITVVERQHPVRHVNETCTGNGVEFTNEYWFESGNFLRKSKQLLVPTWGAFELQRVIDKG